MCYYVQRVDLPVSYVIRAIVMADSMKSHSYIMLHYHLGFFLLKNGNKLIKMHVLLYNA